MSGRGSVTDGTGNKRNVWTERKHNLAVSSLLQIPGLIADEGQLGGRATRSGDLQWRESAGRGGLTEKGKLTLRQETVRGCVSM